MHANALNALEIAARTTPPDASGVIHVTLSAAEESIQEKAVVYDADGDAHYDTISAFIKSLRGSDPDAALYWLAKMLHAGEDIRFIARRLIICASEDVGMADSNALVVATSAQQAVEFVGLPEAQLILAHATRLRRDRAQEQSLHGSHRQGVRGGARGPHSCRSPGICAMPTTRVQGNSATARATNTAMTTPGAYVPQAYLPEGRIYYEPTENGLEKRVKERLDHWRALFEDGPKKSPSHTRAATRDPPALEETTWAVSPRADLGKCALLL